MNPMQSAVHTFLVKHLGQQSNGWANPTSTFNKWLLIAEEFDELTEALGIEQNRRQFIVGVPYRERRQTREPDAVATIDAICDLLYVVFNLCEELQIDVEPFFDEVHRSNMTKVTGKLSDTQKVLKGPTFKPPRIHELYEFYKTGWVYCSACGGLGFRRAVSRDGQMQLFDSAGDPVLVDCPKCDPRMRPGFVKVAPLPIITESDQPSGHEEQS